VTLALRRAAPDDYHVIDDGEIVGRIYRIVVAAAQGGRVAQVAAATANLM
jgi:hypothetical protein